jgi:hypothetical protein
MHVRDLYYILLSMYLCVRIIARKSLKERRMQPLSVRSKN